MLLTSSVIIRSHILILGVDPTVKQYASQYDRNVGRVSYADVKCMPPTRTYVPGRHDSEESGAEYSRNDPVLQYYSTLLFGWNSRCTGVQYTGTGHGGRSATWYSSTYYGYSEYYTSTDTCCCHHTSLVTGDRAENILVRGVPGKSTTTRSVPFCCNFI